MPNSIKHSTTGDTQSLKKGNFFFGVGDVGKGPSSSSGHYNGVTPMSGGYTIYSYNVNETSKISFHTANSDLELISYTNIISGQGFTTAVQCLNWYATQTNYACVNKNYEGIITDGLVFNVDAGFIPSYPTNGTTSYDLSYSGNNGNLTNGVGYSTDNGGTFVFDGGDDRISCGNFSVSYLTVSTWVYKTTSTTHQGICRKENGWAISQYNGTLQVAPGTSWVFYDTGYVIPLNTWVNIVYTYSGSGSTGSQVVYINGNSIFSTSAGSGPIFSNSSQVNIGFDDNNWFWNGRIANTLIYNRPLTSSEVLQSYNAGLARFNTANIVKNNLMLNLDASNAISYPTTGTKWNDLSGYGNVGTLANGPTFNSTTRSIVFDGTDDYVSDGSSTYDITNQFTVEVLCNPTQEYNGMFNFVGPNGSDRGMMAHWPWGGDYGYFDITNTSNAFFRWYKAGAGILNVRALYHFILNPNGQVVVKQNNQIMTPSGTDTFTGNVSLGSYNTIGAFSSAQLPWKGEMSKFRVYNRALTDAETTQNYYGSPIITDGLVVALDAGNLVSYPGSGTSWKDLTVNANNSTLYNGPTFSDANGGVISFDGTDDYGLGTISSSIFAGAHSIGCWFYRRSVTQWAGLFSNNVNTSSCSLLTFIDSTNKIGINQAGVSGTDISVDLGSGHLNKWIYCVLVVSGVSNGSAVNVYAYMDGSLLTSSGNLYWNMETSSSYYVSRHWTSGSQILDGFIPQVSVYNRALTRQEVSQNYNAAKSRFGL
jgi:hypothetical protein